MSLDKFKAHFSLSVIHSKTCVIDMCYFAESAEDGTGIAGFFVTEFEGGDARGI